MAVPVLGILWTVFQSIFQVFLLCLAGFALSVKGIVDKPTSKALNHINIALFTPALLFSKVAYFLSPAKLRQLWVIPVFFVVLTGLSALVAHALARACRLKRSQVHFATAASMFMNSNSLPVALMQSLATTAPLLKKGPDDSVDAMFSRSLTYLVVFSTLGMILRWSYGIRLLAKVNEPDTGPPPPTTYRDRDRDADPVTADPQHVDDEDEDVATHPRHVRRTRPLCTRLPHPRLSGTARVRRHSHLPAVPTSLGDHSETDDTDATTEGDSEDTIALRSEPMDTEAEDHAPAPAAEPTPTPRWSRPPRPHLAKRLLTSLTSLSPPLTASLLALLCVLVPPLQDGLKSNAMIPFKGALDTAGACSVPLTLLVLGGWFWDSDTAAKHTDTQGNGKRHGAGTSDGQGQGQGQGGAKRQGKAKTKTKGEGHTKPTNHVVPPSHNSSTASLSSMIGAFGDVLMSRIHPRHGTWRRDADVERGAHAETETESGHRRGSVNGRVRPSSSASSPASSPALSPHTHAHPPGDTLTVIITLVARMAVVPALLTPLMVLVRRLGWGGEVFDDPVFIVASMLLIASPPALTLAQISQRAKTATIASTPSTPPPTTTSAGTGTGPDGFSPFERLLSRTVFWAYLVLTPPVTIVSVMVGLVLIGG